MTTLFVSLICLLWLRFLAISVLAIHDYVHEQRVKIRLDHTNSQLLSEVTILVPAYQEAYSLSRTLDSIRVSVSSGASLIVVDDGSTDRTAEIAQRALDSFGVGQFIRHARNAGKSAALNSGLEAVVTPYVLTLDADTALAERSLEAALGVLSQPDTQQISSVAFDISVEPSAHFLSEVQGIEYDASLNFERRGQSVLNAISVSPGAASLWRTEDLRALGGFSSTTVTEDVDMTLLLASHGKRCRHTAQARAYTEPPATFRSLLVQRRRWSLGHYQNIARHAPRLGRDVIFSMLTYPNFFILSAFLPALCFLSLCTLFSEIGTWQRTLILATLISLATVYAQRAMALHIARRPFKLSAFVVEPFATQCFHLCALGLVIGTIVQSAVGLRTNVWKNDS